MSEGFHEVLRIVLLTIAVNGSPSCIPTIPSANFDSCSFWALDIGNQCHCPKVLGGPLHQSIKDRLNDTLPYSYQSVQSQMVNDEIVAPWYCLPKATFDLTLQLTGLLLVQVGTTLSWQRVKKNKVKIRINFH